MTEIQTQQTLVVMAGPPGAGKTTLALALSRELAWPVVDKDTLKSPLLEVGIPEELAGPASYQLLFEIGRDLLCQGFSVILDSPAAYPVVIQKANNLAHEIGVRLKFILCLADYGERAQRLAERTRRRSQWTTVAGNRDDGSEMWGLLLPANALRVRSDREVSDLLLDILRYLREEDPWNSP